jgi:hypothetical protein
MGSNVERFRGLKVETLRSLNVERLRLAVLAVDSQKSKV